MASPKEKTPTTYQVRVTENAQQDIDYITGYIAFINHQPLNAIRVGDALFETIDRIGQNPLAFRECEEILTAGRNIPQSGLPDLAYYLQNKIRRSDYPGCYS